MVFKKLLGSLGKGAPAVNTVLHQPYAHPGSTVTGDVRIKAGKQDITVEHVALSFAAHVENGYGDPVAVEFHRAEIAERFELSGGEEKVVPFECPMPWETPISNVQAMHLDGIAVGVHTELRVSEAGKDELSTKSDLDPFAIEPLPAQAAVLDAFGRLGIQFRGTGLAPDRLDGVRQELPFFQEIEFFPPPPLAEYLNDVWLTFVADAEGVDVVLTVDKLSRIAASDQIRFRESHDEAPSADWTGRIQGWLQETAEQRAR
ncbi:sporulation-control protein [Saccharopolyspora kobensis]|uniref:Sporulation-control protein n=1 Tax=Saccharopolyspora kobensis TaxID=146035 RepID=A0A1H5Z9W2_9PSEU|nr:sporulation protein [Saccharopolyspora kobensis]SEG33309.1 sporulation-control protein [Saccharopolyspora kobensis]SFF16712.1 sporulation-control protein [Saccharopolyspora kobensis]